MARRTVLIALAVSAAAFAVAAGAFWGLRRPAPDAAADQEAVALFAMKLPDADGVERPLLAWRGKLLVVNFWATWCAPCVEEMPELQRFADEFAPRNVAVIGIGVDDADKIRDFRSQHRLRIPLLAAGFDGAASGQPGTGAALYCADIARRPARRGAFGPDPGARIAPLGRGAR